MNVKDYKFSFPIHSDKFYMIMAKVKFRCLSKAVWHSLQ